MFYRIAHMIVGWAYRLLYRLRVTGREHVPEGGVLVCANHSSLSDPIFVALGLPGKYRSRFVSKAELFKIFGLKQLITWLGAYPVERGTSDIKAVKNTIRLLKEGNKVILFPHGKRISGDGESEEMKSGAAMIASHAGVPLLPVYLTPGRKIFVNKVEVIIGKPLVCGKQIGNSSAQYNALSRKLHDTIYELKKQTGRNRNA